jgi:hypothetical protein
VTESRKIRKSGNLRGPNQEAAPGAIAGRSGANGSGIAAKVGSSISDQTAAFPFTNQILRNICAGQSLQLM